MTYEENMKLVDAAIMLREYCKSDDGKCGKCIFFDSSGCAIYETPRFWSLPIITRWTPEDVALAKALKAVGAELIYRSGKNEAVYWRGNSTMDLGVLPADAFVNMGNCESLFIDTIIKEAEG